MEGIGGAGTDTRWKGLGALCGGFKVDHILNRERARVRWGRPKSIAAIAVVAEATKIPRGTAEGMISRTMCQGSSSLADGIAYGV